MTISSHHRDNLVIISNIEWGYLKQRHQNFALALSDDYNVVFVESSAKRNPSWQDIPRIANRLSTVFTVNKSTRRKTDSHEKVTIITPVVFPSTFKVFRLLNSLFLSRRLVQQIKTACIANRKTTLMTYLPSSTVMDIIQLLRHNTLLYDCVSNFAGIKEMPADTETIEQQLIRKSDCVFVDCDFLYEKHRGSANRIELIEPGVDFALFNSIEGKTCQSIRKIIYYGAISNKIDFNVLRYLAGKDIAITLIGPITFQHDRIDQIQYLPQVDHDKLPSALEKADALIIPYLHNEFMLGVIPAKFFECFATGKPVITTWSDNYKRYDNLILQGRTPEDIYQKITLIDQYETYGKQQKRIDIARKQDWKILSSRIISCIDSSMQNKD